MPLYLQSTKAAHFNRCFVSVRFYYPTFSNPQRARHICLNGLTEGMLSVALNRRRQGSEVVSIKVSTTRLVKVSEARCMGLV